VVGPRVSICIPTYDRLHYLREAVTSARAQTLTDIEVVIGDDGSSADLRAWCLAQAVEDPRVRYLKTPGRVRLAGNWTFLADHARGVYATFIGDDDRLLPTFAERLSAEADRSSTSGRPIDVVFSNHYVIDAEGRRLTAESEEATRSYGRGSLRTGPIAHSQALVWRNAVPMLASIVRTDIVRRLRFKSDLNTPELELFVRMASEDSRFSFVDDYLAEYRVHAASETSSGLTIDRLAEYLQDVPVAADAELAKTRCLTKILVGGVGVRLRRGDVSGARALRASRYYPRDLLNKRALAQRLLLSLPERLIAPVYAELSRLRSSPRDRR
jgi:glycosyltransferase involved in cell wall biosynthesis